MYDRPMPKIREQMERIVGLMCDEYCKWPEKVREKNRDNMEEAQDELLERYCAKCPLNRIS